LSPHEERETLITDEHARVERDSWLAVGDDFGVSAVGDMSWCPDRSRVSAAAQNVDLHSSPEFESR
jgi:hypothetical protein